MDYPNFNNSSNIIQQNLMLCGFADSPNAVQEVTNFMVYNYYKTRLMNAYMSRLKYEDLTDTCDETYLETTFMLDGTATLMQENVTGKWLSVGYVYRGNLNVYKYPTDIRGVGYGAAFDSDYANTINYTNIEPRDKNFAIGFDNPTRTLPFTTIDFFARQLWEQHMIFRNNLQVQSNPYVITAPKKQAKSINELLLKLFGKERSIEVDNTKNIEDVIKVVDLKVEYKGNEFMQTMETIWNQALAFLGIMSETDKKERLLSTEASMNQWENQLALAGCLREREKMLNWAIRLGYPGNPNVKVNTLSPEVLDFKLPEALKKEGEN